MDGPEQAASPRRECGNDGLGRAIGSEMQGGGSEWRNSGGWYEGCKMEV